jgi:prepilin-type N-terminal cleavage/methylation domain-containing protein
VPRHHFNRRIHNALPAGFSFIELMISMTILLVVSAVVLGGVASMTKTNGTINNRVQMHASVRSATELLQQEIGQAGRVSLPTGSVTLSAAVTASTATVGVSSTAGMFTNEKLIIDTGDNQETVDVIAVGTSDITATFTVDHAANAVVRPAGAFASGIVPSSGPTKLKLYGDIDDNGTMVYVEYTCENGFLYRNAMPITAASKPGLTPAMILLSNVLPNPGGTACFTYQPMVVGPDTYVTNVAVTLTLQTQEKDPQTNLYQTETKALLNVSPRNVFEAWQMASAGVSNRIQPMPASVTNLLPD